jgi:hypothetical protein
LPHRVTDRGEKEITVRLADREGERNDVNMLINRRYSARGYGNCYEVPTADNAVTFTASSRGTLVGTLSLTVDSAAGLAADMTFKEELDQFRRVKGARICELTRFAFETTRPSLDLLASLFHIIFIYGTHRYDCTDLFIEVAQRHRRFYETMLGFQQVGLATVNDSVGVPSHLMWLKVSDIRRHIDGHAGNGRTSMHSLYAYFFSKKEELGIYARLIGEATENPRSLSESSKGQVRSAVQLIREAASPTLSRPIERNPTLTPTGRAFAELP